MATSDCDVLVVGAGVTGLTTAICLAEQGLRVLVQAGRPPQETTSAVAGAIWGPHLVEAGGRAERWSSQTLTVLRELATEPGTGVRIATGIEAVRPAGRHDGRSADDAKFRQLGGYQACDRAELPAGFAAGWRYAAPLAHMPTYLGYLLARFERGGGELAHGTVTSLADAGRAAGARAVVNCTGTGARQLVPDTAVTPVRGQVVVAANPGLSEFFIGRSDESAELVYVFPHGDQVVLGGTEKPGDWNTDPSPAVAERILADVAAAEPRLRDAEVLTHRVGLRPVRPSVRLEAEAPDGQDGLIVVHNYGHGGAGVSLSWGCAREAADLVVRSGPPR
ncbi:MAG TPA: FAD-dependent oxidoreductase [Streptosporangiaceae bacterium]